MAVSILHRLSGAALTFAGLLILAWWLTALSKGGEAYVAFQSLASRWWALLVLVGLTWAFFQHLFAGLRHMVLDIGAGYELRVNRFWAVMTMVGALFATALTWFFLMGVGR